MEGGSDPEFFRSGGPFRGLKRDLYEGGIRAPMIAWAPGRIPSGRVSDFPWAMWDILPTFAELAGAGVPAEVDGLSMTALLTAAAAPPEHEYLYWEFYERGSAQAARFESWKAVRKPMFTGEIELYDLAGDPGETVDVADQHPEVIARMAQIMEEAHVPSPMWQVAGASNPGATVEARSR